MHQDFLELLRFLNDYKVRYLVIGGYAVIRYSEPRYTKDLDIWVEASKSNATRVLRALSEFGAPIDNLTAEDLATPGLIYVFGIPPVRIDILNKVKGATFETAWKSKETAKVQETKIKFVSKKTLIKIKAATGREQDKADLVSLRRAP